MRALREKEALKTTATVNRYTQTKNQQKIRKGMDVAILVIF